MQEKSKLLTKYETHQEKKLNFEKMASELRAAMIS